jgi:hypothetical protein
MVCQQISALAKIGQNYRAAYMNIYVCFVLLTTTCSSTI